MTKAVLGIIGGSGIYDLPGLEDRREERISTPWGEPSDALMRGRIGSTEIVFLSRHGRGHRIPPDAINYRANIDALKRVGVTDLISLSACGSFKPELYPGLFVLVDQFVDRTWGRASSFFGPGCVAHVSMAHPTSPHLMDRLADAAAAENVEIKRGGTYVCMQGPQFSSYAESITYKAQDFDVIGMTAMPEAKLAREAEICYCTLAMVTDYDSWRDGEAVSVEDVLAVMHRNVALAHRVVRRFAASLPQQRSASPIDTALDNAVMTAPAQRDPMLKAKLHAVAGRVL